MGAWIRWILLSEGLILLLAVAGPGHRYVIGHHSDPTLIARFFIDDPGFLETVGVNLVAVHLFIAATWLAAWIVGRHREE